MSRSTNLHSIWGTLLLDADTLLWFFKNDAQNICAPLHRPCRKSTRSAFDALIAEDLSDFIQYCGSRVLSRFRRLLRAILRQNNGPCNKRPLRLEV
jgi:hypothetical protein